MVAGHAVGFVQTHWHAASYGGITNRSSRPAFRGFATPCSRLNSSVGPGTLLLLRGLSVSVSAMAEIQFSNFVQALQANSSFRACDSQQVQRHLDRCKTHSGAPGGSTIPSTPVILSQVIASFKGRARQKVRSPTRRSSRPPNRWRGSPSAELGRYACGPSGLTFLVFSGQRHI